MLASLQADMAEAVLILANRRAEDQDEEDAANIMRVTAVKNLSPDIRVILQLLQHHNKVRAPCAVSTPCPVCFRWLFLLLTLAIPFLGRGQVPKTATAL